NLDATGVADPALPKTVPVGGLSYSAHYNGSTTYNGSTSACEPLDASKLDSSTATDIHNATHGVITTAPIGTPVHDSATATGTAAGGIPTGDVTFSVWLGNKTYPDTVPSALPTVNLDATGVADPALPK